MPRNLNIFLYRASFVFVHFLQDSTIAPEVEDMDTDGFTSNGYIEPRSYGDDPNRDGYNPSCDTHKAASDGHNPPRDPGDSSDSDEYNPPCDDPDDAASPEYNHPPCIPGDNPGFNLPSHLNNEPYYDMLRVGATQYNCDDQRDSDVNFTSFIHPFPLGKAKFACKVCNREFTQASNLRRHDLIHTGERPFDCETCNKKFSRLSDLRRHSLVHTGERPFLCMVCKEGFSQASVLQRHIKRIHSGKLSLRSFIQQTLNKRITQTSQRTVPCQDGDNASCDSNGVSLDFNTAPLRDGDAPCDGDVTKCGGGNAVACDGNEAACDGGETEEGVDLNMECHSEEEGYEASWDGDARHSPQRIVVNDQLPYLAGRVQYVCKTCHKRFTQASNLRRHNLIHTGERAFFCETCNKTFTELSGLRRHQITHTRERSFHCGICIKTFTRASCLRRHLQSHCTIDDEFIDEDYSKSYKLPSSRFSSKPPSTGSSRREKVHSAASRVSECFLIGLTDDELLIKRLQLSF